MKNDIEKNRNKINELKSKNLERERKISDLEQSKQDLLDARTGLESSDIDDDIKKTIVDALNQSMEKNKEKGQELSREMQQDVENVESIKEETDTGISDIEEQSSQLSQYKGVLEKVGISGVIDSSLSKLEDRRNDFESVKADAMDAASRLDELAHRAEEI